MIDIDNNFRESLIRWWETKYDKDPPRGKISEWAKKFGFDQSSYSNILARRRFCGTEIQRRHIASVIGIPYDAMIGINGGNPDHTTQEIKDLRKTNQYQANLLDVLYPLIKLYYQGDERVDTFLKGMEKRLAHLETTVAQILYHMRNYCPADPCDPGQKERECYKDFIDHIEPLIRDLYT